MYKARTDLSHDLLEYSLFEIFKRIYPIVTIIQCKPFFFVHMNLKVPIEHN